MVDCSATTAVELGMISTEVIHPRCGVRTGRGGASGLGTGAVVARRAIRLAVRSTNAAMRHISRTRATLWFSHWNGKNNGSQTRWTSAGPTENALRLIEEAAPRADRDEEQAEDHGRDDTGLEHPPDTVADQQQAAGHRPARRADHAGRQP